MHLKGHDHCFMHFLASKHCLGHFWAPPLMQPGYGARYELTWTLGSVLDKALNGIEQPYPGVPRIFYSTISNLPDVTPPATLTWSRGALAVTIRAGPQGPCSVADAKAKGVMQSTRTLIIKKHIL